MKKNNEQLFFLKKSIANRIIAIKSRKVFYRKEAYYIYLSTAVLAALTTILSGLKIPEISEIARISIMIIGSLITLINTYSAFYHHKEMWVANNEALNKFYELNFDIEFNENGDVEITKEKIDEYKKSYQTILNELNQTWNKSKNNK